MINYKKEKLNSGLRVITAPMKDTKAVTILVLIGAGSRNEQAKNNGVAHFLEHMFFKGTTKRPTTLDISKELDGLGAEYNAFTSEEFTGFYVRVAGDDFPKALDILHDMLFNPLFDPKEIEREKGVIIQEIRLYQDTPPRYIYDLAKALLFGDTPLGRNIAGTEKIISGVKRQDFLEFRHDFYAPENMIVAVAGSENKTLWSEAIKNYFSKFEKAKSKGFEPAKIKQKEPHLLLHYKKTDQAHLFLGHPAIKRTDPRRPVIRVLSNILGGTMSSRLFIEVRERRGLAYYVRSDYADYRDNGALGALAGVDVKKVEEAITVILSEFDRMRTIKVTAEELKRAKENLKGHLYLGLEESMSVAEFLVDQEMFWGKIQQPEEIIEDVMKVTADDILKLAQEIFVPEKLNFAVIGPFKDEGRFRKLLKY